MRRQQVLEQNPSVKRVERPDHSDRRNAIIEGGQVGMRDSKNVTGPVLGISREEWRAFLGGIRNGEFDNFSA
jgi:hypothetical protein